MRKRINSKLDMNQKIDDLTLLSVEQQFDKNNRTRYLWTCQCKCGNTCKVYEKSLLDKSRHHSCGCYKQSYLQPGNMDLVIKAGKARANIRNKDGVNVDMLFRDNTISTNTSGVQGVSWSKSNNKWHTYVGYQGRRATLGYFEDLEDAKKVRQMCLDAIKNGTFEEFFKKLRGKDYKSTYKKY